MELQHSIGVWSAWDGNRCFAFPKVFGFGLNLEACIVEIEIEF
jgi:hypothetical protein